MAMFVGFEKARPGPRPRRWIGLRRALPAPRGRAGDSLWIAGESDPCELSALVRLKKVLIGLGNVTAGRGTRSTAQDILIAHEFAIVFAQCTRLGAITG